MRLLDTILPSSRHPVLDTGSCEARAGHQYDHSRGTRSRVVARDDGRRLIVLLILLIAPFSLFADEFDWDSAENITHGSLEPLPGMKSLTYRSGYNMAAHKGYERAVEITWMADDDCEKTQLLKQDMGDSPYYVHVFSNLVILHDYYYQMNSFPGKKPETLAVNGISYYWDVEKNIFSTFHECNYELPSQCTK